MKSGRKRGIDEIISEIRGKVNQQFPQLDVEFIQSFAGHDRDLTYSPTHFL